MRQRIALVEDEEHIARGLRFNFEREGYEVELFDRGGPALERLVEGPDASAGAPEPDLVVLDLMLPDVSGLEILRRLREVDTRTPVLILTARDSEEAVVAGLDLGADDYLTKPFSLAVLLARVRTLLRRSARSDAPEDGDDSFRVGDVTVWPDRFELERGGETQPLTAKELGLLQLLWQRRGRAVSREEILEQVWQLRPDTRTRVVDTFVLRLRKLIERDPSNPAHLLSVRSFGYRLVEGGAS